MENRAHGHQLEIVDEGVVDEVSIARQVLEEYLRLLELLHIKEPIS